MFRDPIAFGLQSERAKQQDAAIAAATAEVADVADDEELASYAGLVGKRLYDEDDDVAAEIVSIDTASSRGGKYEEIRATCVELIDDTVPDCALTLTGKVSPRCHTCISFSHSHSHFLIVHIQILVILDGFLCTIFSFNFSCILVLFDKFMSVFGHFFLN